MRVGRLLLARHGESEFNRAGRISGQLDPELSSTGLRQAEALREVGARYPIDAIYTSALIRTKAMAGPVAQALGLPIRPMPALNELCHGILQGRYVDARDPGAQCLWRMRNSDKLSFVCSGGESIAQLQQRVLACWRDIELEQRGATILLIGHRNTNRILMGHLLWRTMAEAMALKVRNKYVYELCEGSVATLCLQPHKLGKRYEYLRF